MADATRVVLIRHGAPQWPIDGFVGGHRGCTGLSDEGRRQVEALRDRLSRTGELAGASALYASILPRAIETAEIIAPAVGGLPVETDCELCEIHMGEADGVAVADLEARWGRWVERRFAPLDEPYAPGGESWADFMARAGRRLRRLVAEHEGETVVVACHGGIVRASFHAFGNHPLAPPFETEMEMASITEWRRQPDAARWTLVRFNDAAHLLG